VLSFVWLHIPVNPDRCRSRTFFVRFPIVVDILLPSSLSLSHDSAYRSHARTRWNGCRRRRFSPVLIRPPSHTPRAIGVILPPGFLLPSYSFAVRSFLRGRRCLNSLLSPKPEIEIRQSAGLMRRRRRRCRRRLLPLKRQFPKGKTHRGRRKGKYKDTRQEQLSRKLGKFGCTKAFRHPNSPLLTSK
jgi:hypothetical protein